jgi:membrane protein DedA with SNARE-associated domain
VTSHLWRPALLAIVMISLAAAAVFGARSVRTFTLLQSAQAIAAPETGIIRGWMTLDYVAAAFAVDPALLARDLAVQGDALAGQPIRSLAAARGIAVLDMVREVQKAVANRLARSGEPAAPDGPEAPDGWFDALTQRAMSGVLIYGFPALAAAVFLGSLGLPLPAGPATALAGSLAAPGRIDGTLAMVVALAGSFLGDLVAYSVGRSASPSSLSRWGRWIGLTEANRRRVRSLFRAWGAAAVVLGMSAVSQVSSAVGVLAGLSRWPMPKFLAAALAGRILWTAGYFGLGYLAGANFAAASGVLGNLGLTIIALLAAAAAAYGWRRARPSQMHGPFAAEQVDDQ